MAKSQLIKDITTNKISLEEGLQRLLIIISDLENKSLEDWILNELNGYGDKTLPSYRKNLGCRIVYTGRNGAYNVKNQPLTLSFIPKKYRDKISQTHSNEGTRVIEKIINNNETVGYDLTELAGVIYENSGIQCLNITKQLNILSFEGIISSIKNKLIIILLDLEKKFGSLDNLDIDVSSLSKEETKNFNQQINRVFYDDKSEVVKYD